MQSVRTDSCLSGCAALALPALLIVVTACQQKDYADKRLAARETRISETIQSAERREGQNAARLKADAQWIEDCWRDDATDTADNVQEVKARWEAERERFEARQPQYQKDVWRVLRGQPERIERTAISMFY